ncbi:MAG TPA: hypothetical protein VG992_03720 [Candidatus Saccharimonadales bacterium]|nr:hypothetical protein [Candidatus Saccharimonadales bacterium]
MTWRSLLITALVVVGVSSIAYAALTSQPAIVKGNTIQTGTANLLVSADGTNYSNSVSGYTFGGLIPGGQAMPNNVGNGYPIYVKNAGNTGLLVSLSIPAGFTNPNNLDLSKAHLILTPMEGGAAQTYSLQALAAGPVQLSGAIGHIAVGQSFGYAMQVQLDSDAVTGSSASLSNLEFDFVGTGVN